MRLSSSAPAPEGRGTGSVRRTPEFLVCITNSQTFISQSEKQTKVSLKSVETLEKNPRIYSVDNPRPQERESLVIAMVLLEH